MVLSTRRDGAELFYVDLQGRLRGLSVRRSSNGATLFGVPVALNVPPIGPGHFGTQYNVSAEGARVYFMDRSDEQQPREIGFILGWNAPLK